MIDTTNNTVSTITGFTEPYGVAVSPNGDVYVTNYDGNSVAVIDPATNTVTATIAAPNIYRPEGVAFSSATGDLYVANSASHTVSVINPTTDTVIDAIASVDHPDSVVAL